MDEVLPRRRHPGIRIPFEAVDVWRVAWTLEPELRRRHEEAQPGEGHRSGALRLAGAHERVQTIVSAPEQPTDPALPGERFNVAALDGARRMALPAYIAVWGLRLEGVVPDMEAVERLLEARYRYWSDDVEHDDPFPWVYA